MPTRAAARRVCGSPARRAGRSACGACAAGRSAFFGARRASMRARLCAQPCAASVRIGARAATSRARAPSASGSAASGGGSNASKPAQLTSSPSPSSALGASANSCAPGPLVNPKSVSVDANTLLQTQKEDRSACPADDALALISHSSQHRPVSPQFKPAHATNLRRSRHTARCASGRAGLPGARTHQAP